MKTFPNPLSTKEEQQCLLACSQGDKKAREQLIMHNMRLVAHMVKKYSHQERNMEDLLSVGTVGLIKAIDSYQMDRGIRLATYASCCIENELLMLFRSEKKLGRDVSLSEPIGSDKEGNEISLLDVLESQQEDLAETMDLKQDISMLGKYMKQVLSEREQEILILRYGLFGQKALTQREIAGNMQISRSYVSRIEKKILAKLRACYQAEGRLPD